MSALTQPQRQFAIHMAGLDWFITLAGMQLDLFTPLDERPLRADELAATLGLDADKLGRLLHGLVVAGLLTVDDGRFANTPEAAQFLVRGKPTYRGGVHTNWAEIGQAGLLLAESLRANTALAGHDYRAMTEEQLYATLGGLHGGGLAKGRALAARYDLASCRTILDAAGGSGGVSIGLAGACPDLRVTLADLPHVLPVARRFIAEAGLADRIAVVGHDLVREAVPGPFDAAVASLFTQVLTRDDARAALRNIARSLRPGGTLYLSNQVLDESRVSPAAAVRVNALMVSFYDHGEAYTEGEYRAWLAEAGFAEVTRDADLNGLPLILARMPA